MTSTRTLWAVSGAALTLTIVPVAASIADNASPVVDHTSSTSSAAASTAAELKVHPAALASSPQPPESEPVTLLSRKAKGEKKSERGDRFVRVSTTGSNDVPEAALRAYKNAENVLDSTRPGCDLPWTLLAAIGRVESDHGRYADSQLGSDGVSRPAILGLRLDGAGPVAAIRDTDNGRLDGDKVWDRAVGQMQFIPSTWAMVASDGDDNGTRSPNDLDDAAVGAGRYLCAGGFSVADTSGLARAIYSYNHSDYYVALVMAFKRGYETGVFVIPSPPPPPGAGDDRPERSGGKHRKDGKSSPDSGGRDSDGGKKGAKSGGSGSGSTGGSSGPRPPKPAPSPQPSPSPSPSPAPTPEPPTLQLAFGTGVLTECGGGYCLGDRKLGLGPDDQLSRQAAHDYDRHDGTGSNAQEFSGLAASGDSIRIGYELEDGVAVVYVVGDWDYRFADGTFA